MIIINIIKQAFENKNYIITVILFGSRVKGAYSLKSDYDLCIVVKNEENKSDVMKEIIKLMQQTNILIHPFIYTNHEFNLRMDSNVYYQNIIQNGLFLVNHM